MVAIAPSMLAADMSRLGEELQAVEKIADMIHLDVMDGHFVPNLSFGLPVIAALRPLTTKPFDVHLMIDEPERWVDRYIEAGADIVSIHAESCRHLDSTLSRIRESGKKAGIALNPATPADVVTHVLDKIDIIVVMSVNPGFGGQSYIAEANKKITDLREMTRNTDILIEVDGGINDDTARTACRAGADILVAGSFIFKHNDTHAAIANLRKCAADLT